MKQVKIILTALFMALISHNATAQNISYAIQAGANLTVQSGMGDIYDNDDARLGINVGGYVNYTLNNNLSMQAELNYDQKGSKYSGVTYEYNYVSLPLLVRYNLYNEANTKGIFDVYAGPYVSALLLAESNFSNSELENKDLSECTNDFGVGVNYGFVFKYPVSSNYLFLNLRFGLELSAYDKNDNDPRNKYLGLSLGYEF